jgi:hypothetical protein
MRDLEPFGRMSRKWWEEAGRLGSDQGNGSSEEQGTSVHESDPSLSKLWAQKGLPATPDAEHQAKLRGLVLASG